MLKILYFVNTKNTVELRLPAVLCDLKNLCRDSRIVVVSDKAREPSGDASAEPLFVSADELFSSSVFDDEDMLFPIFEGESFDPYQVKEALGEFDGGDALVLSHTAMKISDVNLLKRSTYLVKLSERLFFVRYGAFDKKRPPVIDFSLPDEARALLLCYACLETKRLKVIPCSDIATLSEADFGSAYRYKEKFFEVYEALGSYCLERFGCVEHFVQYLLGRQLIARFAANRSKSLSCPEICEEGERTLFFENCKRILRFVDSRIIMRLDKTDFMKIPEPGIAMLRSLKKGSLDFSLEFEPLKANGNLYCCLESCAITSTENKSAAVRRVKILKNGDIHLRVFTNGIFEKMGCEFKAYCDRVPVKVKTVRTEELSYFGYPLFEKPVFGVNIPEKLIHRGSKVEFSYKYDSCEYKLKVAADSDIKEAQAEIELTNDCLVFTDDRFPVFEEKSKDEDKRYSCLLLLRSNPESDISDEEAVAKITSSNNIYEEGRLHIVLVTEEESDRVSALERQKNVFCCKASELSGLEQIRRILLKHGCDLVTTLKVGDLTDAHYFDDAVCHAESNNVATVVPFVTHDEDYIGFGNECGDLNESPELTPINFEGAFYKKELFFRESLGAEQWDRINEISFDDERQTAAFCLLTYENKRVFILRQQVLRPFASLASDGKSYGNASKPEWYFPSVEGFFMMIEGLYPDRLPITVQYTLFNRLLYRLHLNENQQDTHIITEELLPLWKKSLAKICQRIDNEVIADVFLAKRFHTSPHISRWLLGLKNEASFTEGVVLFKDDLAYKACDCQLMLLSNQTVKIELMDYTDDCVVIDCSIAGFFEMSNIFPEAELDGKKIPIEVSFNYASRKLYSEEMWRRFTFRVKLPFSLLKKGTLSFCYCSHGYRYPLSLSTGRYTAKLNRSVPGSYWVCRDFIFSFTKKFTGIRVEEYTNRLAHQKEKVLQRLCVKKAPYFERENVRRLMDIRNKYFASRKHYLKKNIWLTFDKLYKAGDNADYFYRYAVKQKDGAELHYVINKGYPDAEKFLKDKLKPLYFTSKKHILHFLNSRIVATTHAGLPVFSGVPVKDFKYLQDLFNADVVCIQHGLAVQWMPHNLYSGYDNVKRFYCATQSELNNLGMPEYDYAEGALRLTGLSRYDGLVDKSKRQILISPTWRSYIAMPSSAGNTRPYSETFKETEYFRIYNGLVNNKKLAETAERCGYHIVYLLHPTLSNQLEDFTPAGNIEVRSPVGESYEKIMTESDLMVTDFSGIQFDFAYMRKPLVYYHPDELPAGYGEGGFSYEEQAFGPICKTEDEVVDTICRYMENECKTEPFYLERQNGFFAFDDRENCKRIYEEILEFSKKQASKDREVVGVRFGGEPIVDEENISKGEISWLEVKSACGYEVLCSGERDGFYKSYARVGADTLSLSVSEGDRENYFKVRALYLENRIEGSCSDPLFI